jgi:WD40 repeat protein
MRGSSRKRAVGLLLACGVALVLALTWMLAQSPRLRHGKWVTGVQFVPGSDLIASAGWANGARVWDLHRGDLKWQLRPEGIATALACSPDGRYISAGLSSLEGGIYLWNAKTGALARKLSPEISSADYRAARFSPDSRTLAIAGYPASGAALVCFDVDAEGMRTGIPSPDRRERPSALAYSLAGDVLVVGCEGGEFIVLDARKLEERRRTLLPGGIVGVEFLDPEEVLVAVRHSGGEGWARDNKGDPVRGVVISPRLCRVSLENLQITPLLIDTGPIEAMALSPDRRFVACADSFGVLYIFSMEDGRKLSQWTFASETADYVKDANGPPSLCFSADGTRIAVGGGDARVRIGTLNGGQFTGQTFP